ncbi:hypothetical protein OHC33_005965 [Knufia fluminis]|uniref:Flavin-containing monooxygenase n=1 Tax=Knufia fluminis TaxID=191047 RepID=A0AAN8ESU1_9EURO|nr:hypothetical protein OHC33_005965 [Knufia fluminis]
MTDIKQPSAAVIGLGAQGLVTVKNLLEEGYDVTGFDRNEYVGGVWHYAAEHNVTALPSTVVNISRERACFTDFPFPDGTSSYPSSAEVDRYLNGYADAFNLRPHLRLGTTIQSITRNETKNTWSITVQSRASSQSLTLDFDKLVLAVGPHSKPIHPQIANQQAFTGVFLHSIAFKDPHRFANKRVLVIGASNTAADTCTSLIGIASKVYISHRHGALILPRILKDGTSLDHSASYRTFALQQMLDAYLPNQARMFFDAFLARIVAQEFGALNPEWRFTPAPSLDHQVPTVSDTLVPALRAGTITSCAAPARISGEHTVELQDGTIVEVDAIICCTGYHLDLSLLGPYDPTKRPGAHLATPALYQNIFSLDYPDSLAFIGLAITPNPAFLIADLSSMALAQLWSRKPSSSSLPPKPEMQNWYAAHLAWVAGVRAKSPHEKFVKLTVRNGPWLSWVDEVAGLDMSRHLSYLSGDAWRFWWEDRKLCGLVLGGIFSPHMYRLFESGRRRRWEGARSAVFKVNEDVSERIRRRREGKDETAT